MEIFDFEKNNCLEIQLDDLKRTYKENDILGKPLMGIYHYELIEKVIDSINKFNYNVELKEIFAAQNKDKTQPGVVLNPALEVTYGPKAVEAHVLRRVYSNIAIHDFDTAEIGTNVAVSFHQKGIAIAYGPMVHICHNQCILGAERIIQINRNNPLDLAIKQFEEMMEKLPNAIEEDNSTINRMKNTPMKPADLASFIGYLNFIRVKHDTANKNIHEKDTYPLNNAQINKVAEDILIDQFENQNDPWTLWRVYNICTNIMKADQMAIPEMIPQHLALTNFCKTLLS